VRLSPSHGAASRRWGGVLRDGRLGAPALVRVRTGRLLARVRASAPAAAASGDARWWSPIINAEHLACATGSGMVDLTASAVFDVRAGTLDYVQRLLVAQADVPVGRVVYTPLLKRARGMKGRPDRPPAPATPTSDRHPAVASGCGRKWFVTTSRRRPSSSPT